MAVFQYFQDKAGKWRWRLLNDEGNIIATSGQGYSRKIDCLHGIEITKNLSPVSDIHIYETEEEFSVYKEVSKKPPIEMEPETPEEPPEEEEEEEVPVPDEPDLPPQPEDIPPNKPPRESEDIPSQWKKPNWALFISIGAVIIIFALILIFSICRKPEPAEEEPEPVKEEQVEPKPVPPPEKPSPPEPAVADTVKEEPLEEKVVSPELKKTPEKVVQDVYHTVVRGDKLWSLADEYYSDAYLWPNIYRANPQKIKNPDILRIGIELLIPGLEGTHLKLSKQDINKIAVGYVRAYLAYKKVGKPGSLYYLWVARKYDPTVLKDFQGQIDLKDLDKIQRIKSREEL